jgi:hypothetical protein
MCLRGVLGDSTAGDQADAHGLTRRLSASRPSPARRPNAKTPTGRACSPPRMCSAGRWSRRRTGTCLPLSEVTVVEAAIADAPESSSRRARRHPFEHRGTRLDADDHVIYGLYPPHRRRPHRSPQPTAHRRLTSHHTHSRQALDVSGRYPRQLRRSHRMAATHRERRSLTSKCLGCLCPTLRLVFVAPVTRGSATPGHPTDAETMAGYLV